MASISKLCSFIPLPMAIVNSGLSSTSILVYGILISRATLSQKNGWVDENGYVYIKYSNKELANDIGKSISTVKNCMKELAVKGLIVRKRIAIDAKLIYVMIPEENLSNQKLATKQTEYYPKRGQYSNVNGYRKVATNYVNEINYRNKEYRSKEGESF
jgi:predicted transcriptional regulator